MENKVMKLLAAVLALGATFCWGTDQVLGKIAMRDLDVATFNAIRPTFALIFIFPYALLTGGVAFPRLGLMLLAALAGIIGNCAGTSLYFYIMKRSPAYKVISVANSGGLWVAIIAILFLGEKAKPIIVISVILVILGTYFLASKKGNASSRWKWSIILALSVSIMWGLEVPIMKYCVSQGMLPSTYQPITITAAAVTSITAMLAHHSNQKLNFTSRGIKISLLSGFFAFFLGFVLWLSAITMETASAMAPFMGGTILFGFVLSVMLLKERPTMKAFLGMITIFLGILLVAVWA